MHLEWLSIHGSNIDDVRFIRTVHCIVSCRVAELRKSAYIFQRTTDGIDKFCLILVEISSTDPDARNLREGK